MNWLVAYLVVGSIMVGGSMAAHSRSCPNDKLKNHDLMGLAAAALIWPGIVVWGLFGNSQHSTTCVKE